MYALITVTDFDEKDFKVCGSRFDMNFACQIPSDSIGNDTIILDCIRNQKPCYNKVFAKSKPVVTRILDIDGNVIYKI